MKYVLIRKDGNGYYNGSMNNGWSFNEKERSIELNPEHIYDSKDQILNLENYHRLQYWFKIVPMESGFKPVCPYKNFCPPKPIIKTGKGGETCVYCGTNILPDEPFLMWKDKQYYCLHCVMHQLRNIKELYGSIPANLKEEWQATGKDRMKKCMEHI